MAINPENVTAAKKRVLDILQKAGEILEKNNGSFDSSATFGSTELAFCSLAAICILPKNYANGAADLPDLDTFDAEFQKFVQQCRSTLGGKFVLRSYQDNRIPK